MTRYALYLAIILYGALSSPTPDSLSWPEYIIFVCLIVSVGVIRPLHGITTRDLSFHLHVHRGFLIYMLIVPSIIAVIGGHAESDILRDILPLVALVLPLCFYRNQMGFLSVPLVFAGGLFALRYVAPMIPQFDFIESDASLLYLANSPLVPFAAIMGFHWLTDVRLSFLSKRLMGICLVVICFTAMAVMLQRAPLILSALACLIILGIRTVHKPIQSMVIGSIIMIGIISIYPIIVDIFYNLTHKTLNVGLNNRVEEFQAVIAQSTWFGLGWGGTWQSPAVADIWVRFTHNIISYYWLKAGVIGAIGATIFICVWAWQNLKLIRIDPALGIAIFTPFIIHVTLYSGFKTLDFALLLTLITVCVQNQSSSLTEPSHQP